MTDESGSPDALYIFPNPLSYGILVSQRRAKWLADTMESFLSNMMKAYEASERERQEAPGGLPDR